MFWWYFPRIAVMYCGRIWCANECLLCGLIIAWFHHENAGAQATNNFNNNCQKLQGLPLSGSALLWYNESISDMRQQKYKLKIEIKIPAALRRTYLIRSQVWITIAPYKNKKKKHKYLSWWRLENYADGRLHTYVYEPLNGLWKTI